MLLLLASKISIEAQLELVLGQFVFVFRLKLPSELDFDGAVIINKPNGALPWAIHPPLHPLYIF